MESFLPFPAGTVNVAVGSTTANVSLAVKGDGLQIRIYNASTETAFVNFGGSAVTAVLATSMPIPTGVVEVVTLAELASDATVYAATIGATGGGGSIYFTPGRGL